MNTEQTSESLAILLLTSHVGLNKDDGLAPLNLREWNEFARAIADSEFKTPGSLLDSGPSEFSTSLNLDSEMSERVRRLLDRGGGLAIELERLASMGIWTITRADPDYPRRLKDRLKDQAPAVLFGSGPRKLLEKEGLAVVGSRAIDDAGRTCAEEVGGACAASKLVVYSGGARGTDAIAMQSVIEAGGQAIGVLADSLERTIREPQIRNWLADGQLTLLTPYSPKAGFTVAAAMGRNRLIYALAEYALVVSSEAESGGTWAGATEALRAGWVPVFVRDQEGMPAGNPRLMKRGGISFPGPLPSTPSGLADWLAEHAQTTGAPSLFA